MAPVPQPEEEGDRPNHEHPEIEESDYQDVIINADSSDENEEDDGDDYENMGYQALSMNNDHDSEEEDDSSSEDNGNEDLEGQPTSNIFVPDGVVQQVRLHQNGEGSTLPNYMQVPEVPRPEKEDLLWNQPRNSDICMETGQAEKIRSVMAGIKLPSCNIPDWAKALTDDQWQTQVVSKLRGTSPDVGYSHLQTSGSCVTGFKTDSGTCNSEINQDTTSHIDHSSESCTSLGTS